MKDSDNIKKVMKNGKRAECPYCHTPLVKDAKFCTNCGRRVSENGCPNEDTGDRKSKNKIVVSGIVVLLIVIIGIVVYAARKGKNGSVSGKDSDIENEFKNAAESILAKQSETSQIINTTETEARAAETDSVKETKTAVHAKTMTNKQSIKNRSQVQKQETAVESETETVSDNQNTGHHYELVISDVSWNQAEALCEEKGGHLVTVTSEEEYQTIRNMVEKASQDLMYVWVGGKVSDGRQWGDEGCWITGEKWTYDLIWYPGEPSYYDTDGTLEDCLCFWHVYYGEDDIGWTFNDQRNDLMDEVPSGVGKVGYICEYEE